MTTWARSIVRKANSPLLIIALLLPFLVSCSLMTLFESPQQPTIINNIEEIVTPIVPTATTTIIEEATTLRTTVEMVVSSDSLNVRSIPMVIGEVIDTLSKDDVILVFTDGCVDNEDGHWCEVDYMKGDRKINGFVDTKYLLLK